MPHAKKYIPPKKKERTPDQAIVLLNFPKAEPYERKHIKTCPHCGGTWDEGSKHRRWKIRNVELPYPFATWGRKGWCATEPAAWAYAAKRVHQWIRSEERKAKREAAKAAQVLPQS